MIPSAAIGLLARIAACKYLDHLPFYRIEQIAARQGVPLARSTLADLHAWLLATQGTVAAGSGMAKAVNHALTRWPALGRYAGSGTLPIDNNPVENAIHPIAIGKKN